MKKAGLRKKKLKQLGIFIRHADIVTLQEVHGSHTSLNDALGHIKKSFHVFSSIPARGASGVCVLVRKTFCPNLAHIVPFEVVPGRILRISIFETTFFEKGNADDNLLPHLSEALPSNVVYGIHNFGISFSQFCYFRKLFHSDCARVDSHPQESQVFALGDFNFDPPGGFKGSLDVPSHPWSDVAPPFNSSFAGSPAQLPQSDPPQLPGKVDSRNSATTSAPHWADLLSHCVEIEQPEHTHYNSSSSCTARLDRIYIYSPAWTLTHRRIGAASVSYTHLTLPTSDLV